MAEAPVSPPLQAGSWIGYGVDDLDGSAVGQVHGLFVDAGSGKPSLAYRPLRDAVRGTLVAVPMRDCAAAADRVWVAHGRETIRARPGRRPDAAAAARARADDLRPLRRRRARRPRRRGGRPPRGRRHLPPAGRS